MAYSTNVQLTDQYSDDHLPVYYAPSRVDGVGNDWRYDNDKAVVVNDRRRGGFQLHRGGQRADAEREDLAVSPPLTADERRALPDRLTLLPSLPKLVVSTVDEVTRSLS